MLYVANSGGVGTVNLLIIGIKRGGQIGSHHLPAVQTRISLYGYSAELLSLCRQQDRAALVLHRADVPSFSFSLEFKGLCPCPYALQ